MFIRVLTSLVLLFGTVAAQNVERINPPELVNNGRYTQVMVLPPSQQLVFISGQMGDTKDGKLVGDFAAQAKQAFANLNSALHAAGLTPADIVRIDSYIVDIGKNIGAYRDARRAFFGSAPPPTSTTVGVPALVAEGGLLEVNAIASRPAKGAKQTAKSEDAVFVTALLHSREGKREELAARLRERALASRTEPGCLRYDVLVQKDDPDQFVLNEAWSDQASLDKHLNSPGHEAWTKLRDTLVSNREVKMWKGVEAR